MPLSPTNAQARTRAFRRPRLPAPRLLFLCVAWCAAGLCGEGEPAAGLVLPDAASFRAFDRPSDDGSTISLEWAVSPGDRFGVFYIVEMASAEDYERGEFKQVARFPSGGGMKSDQPMYFGFGKANRKLHYVDVIPSNLYPPKRGDVKPPDMEDPHDRERYARESERESKRLKKLRREINRQTCYFRLAMTDGQQTRYIEEAGQPKVVSAHALPDRFKLYKLNNLLFAAAFCGTVLMFIRVARRNPNLFIRRIAGLDAVEEALGRATEMGRSVFFVHGLGGIGDLSTIASLSILGRVCRRVAEYDTRVRVMNNDAIVTAVSQEVAKQAYTEAGRPDAYNPDDVALVAWDQFSYVAAVGGRMVREKPAAIFLMGYFFAESLLLTETGASTGAIQIAGTDAYTQLPFFIPTCDYTLMGEEMYAASAYLSREPLMLGSLRGQDVGKAFLMVLFVAGTFLATLGFEWLQQVFKAF